MGNQCLGSTLVGLDTDSPDFVGLENEKVRYGIKLKFGKELQYF